MQHQLKEIMALALSDLNVIKKVTQCPKESTVEEAVRLLQTSAGGSVVVVEGKQVLGIFTERDVLRKVTLQPIDAKTTGITQLMTAKPVTVARSSKVGEAIKKMRDGKFRHLVVIDSYGNVEGVLSMRDIADYLAGLLVGS